MFKISIWVSMLCLLTINQCQAWDGKVYVGKYINQSNRAYPDGGIASYIGGVEIGQTIWITRSYINIETISDYQTDSGWFHPASVKYDVGIQMFFSNYFINISHMCWHPVDNRGAVEQYEKIIIGVKCNGI